MPTLDWIGKKAVLNHHREVQFHLLKEVPELSVGDPNAGNLLVQGDNLLALKALLPYYAGMVKCIYIDPPYNTGNEGWVYNDAVNSPEMKEWLGKVVGAEAEDLSRHDKWLCMMYPRLKLLREFLAPDGVMLVSIGEDEIGRLRLLGEEIFGARNHLETFIWQIEGNVENQEAITATHEYVIVFERNPKGSSINVVVDPNVDDDSKLLRPFAENSVVKNGSANPGSVITLPGGFPCSVESLELPATDRGGELVTRVGAEEGYIKREYRDEFGIDYPVRLDSMVVAGGILIQPCRVFSGWSSARKLQRYIDTGCTPLIDDDGSILRFFVSHTGVPTYRRENRKAHFVPTILRNMGTTERASNELERMGVRFPYPKPVSLVEYLVALFARQGDTVMDSFAGSGTTGHAVLKLNAERNLALKCLLVELDPIVAKSVTVPRLQAVIEGYSSRRGTKQVLTDGLGGGLRVVAIGNPIADELGALTESVGPADLAARVFFAESGTASELVADGPFLGDAGGRGVYLLIENGSPAPLTISTLEALPSFSGERVVYGSICRVALDRLKTERITFKQIPYQLGLF